MHMCSVYVRSDRACEIRQAVLTIYLTKIDILETLRSPTVYLKKYKYIC